MLWYGRLSFFLFSVLSITKTRTGTRPIFPPSRCLVRRSPSGWLHHMFAEILIAVFDFLGAAERGVGGAFRGHAHSPTLRPMSVETEGPQMLTLLFDDASDYGGRPTKKERKM